MKTLLKVILGCLIMLWKLINCIPNNNQNIFRQSPNPRSFQTRENNRDPIGRNENKEELPEYQREQLYEAYNLLHSLAQDFQKPFDAPAVLVVGHQTSGKSALIEALMGFQFNQVGGGTKTRRPIALRMQYNAKCHSPVCFLTLENGREEQRTLGDIQSFIENENRKLENDVSKCFDDREINIRVEYKYCPNMIVIDTPGMLHAPSKSRLGMIQNDEHIKLRRAAKMAEDLVLAKMKVQDYIILCVEDTTDWKHATTRNVVVQADPDLSRTVLVTTKLDTKLPQFSEGADLEDFLRAPLIHRLYPQLVGGPFFTSVPSGRVGLNKEFTSNEAFVGAIREAERADREAIAKKIGQLHTGSALKNVGVAQLRKFLESKVEETYRRNVAKIIPLLQNELRNAQAELAKTDSELAALSMDRLKQGANLFREQFAKELASTIHGTAKAPPDRFGETLDQEQSSGGFFLEETSILAQQERLRIVEQRLGDFKNKLFGGAQYHRALREFTIAVRYMGSPVVTEDEIANAAGGMGDVHDGMNFMRAACVLAVEKAHASFDPYLEALRFRVVHIMKNCYPVVKYILSRSGYALLQDTHTQPFQHMVKAIYERFIDMQVKYCLDKCRDDLISMTRFVTWDTEGRGSFTYDRNLPTPSRMVHQFNLAIDREKDRKHHPSGTQDKGVPKRVPLKATKILDEWSAAHGTGGGTRSSINSLTTPDELALRIPEDQEERDVRSLVILSEELMATRGNSNRTFTIVTAVVQHITRQWRDHFARTVAMKFNCFFLMPFIDDFPNYLRVELDRMYNDTNGVNEMFDIVEVKRALNAKRSELQAECIANVNLQNRFDQISAQLKASADRVRNLGNMGVTEEDDSDNSPHGGGGPGGGGGSYGSGERGGGGSSMGGGYEGEDFDEDGVSIDARYTNNYNMEEPQQSSNTGSGGVNVGIGLQRNLNVNNNNVHPPQNNNMNRPFNRASKIPAPPARRGPAGGASDFAGSMRARGGYGMNNNEDDPPVSMEGV